MCKKNIYKQFKTKVKAKLIHYLNSYATCFKSDKLYLKIRYFLMTGRRLNLNNPKGFCEKLQWLKINDRNPYYTNLVDKYLVKVEISKIIGEEYVVKNLGVWDTVEDIDVSQLPERFVLKTTHAAGASGVIICKNKQDFDIAEAKKKLSHSLGVFSFPITREWPYKNISPRVIAEEYLEDETGSLRDFKVMCFNGVPKLIQVHLGRFDGLHTQDFYDASWNKLEGLNQDYCIVSTIKVPKPQCLDEMLRLSSKLSVDIPHVRVDWYIVKDKLYFGEMTFFDASGYDLFIPYSKEIEIGSWINLPTK